MRLATAIKLFAGGEGSGCRGDKCGRPKGSGSSDDKALKDSLHRWTADNPIDRTFEKERDKLHKAYDKGKSHPILDNMKDVHTAPVYRGLSVAPGSAILSLKKGDAYELKPSSFTKSKSRLYEFVMQDGEPVIIKLPAGVKGLDVNKHISRDEMDEKWEEKEFITGGKFRVTQARKVKYEGSDVFMVTLERSRKKP